MSMIEAVETSIKSSIDAGRIDKTEHAAMIEAVRQLAVKADAASDNDNVTFPTMLKYFTALGMVPCEVIQTKKIGKKSTTEKLSAKYRKRGGID